MADIKGLSIFNNTNNGMKVIKNTKSKTTTLIHPLSTIKEPNESEVKIATVTSKVNKNAEKKVKRRVGALIENFDRTHASKQLIKLSPILNATSRSMVEKYETSLNKDELLRKA